MKLQKRKGDLVAKQKQLENAKRLLKLEYFGIDSIIDQLIDNVSSWYLFPEFQKRPHVINLWGMTGTGKTSLIQRLSELLELKDSLYSFEMSKNSRYMVQDTLNDLHDNNSKKPLILLFDEFQHLRSIDEKGKSIVNEMAQIVWKIIDSGKFEDYGFNSTSNNEIRRIFKLKKAIDNGVKVHNGEVVSKKETFMRITNMDITDKDNYVLDDISYMKRRRSFNRDNDITIEEVLTNRKIRFVSYEILELIVSIIDRPDLSLADVEEEFAQLNGIESIKLLKQYLKESLAPKIVDCSKAIVFISGNLDDAYPMSRYLSPDIDATIFYEESLKVDVGDIKSCLAAFLRREQIARLGNIHLIYPSLSKLAYEKIIENQLDKFKKDVKKEHQINLIFTSEIAELIYSEGVYPSQGTRPLLSSIKQLIYNQWSKIIGEIYIKTWQNVNQITWGLCSEGYQITYSDAEEIVGEQKLKVDMPLKTIRQKQEMEDRVVVSVHEAGHALVYRILENQSPKLIIVNSASNDFKGAIITDHKGSHSRNSSIKKIAVLVAGFCAEKLIFGTEAVTYGASDDLLRARLMANSMIDLWGFQEFETSRVYQESFIRKRVTKMDVEQIIDEAFTIASDILKKYEKTLIILSDNLMQKKCMYQDEVEAIFRKHNPSLIVAEESKKYSEMYSMQFQKKLIEVI
ncbi:MAG: hypothetical protein KDB74_03900 [Flavobacteriales bacterium]|nr:hypothetical protein [Flavobacteriales bacterium]